MSKLDDIFDGIRLRKKDIESLQYPYAVTGKSEAKQQIKDLMLMTYHKAVLQDGDTTDNFIKEVESL